MGQQQSDICPVYMKSSEVNREIEGRFIVSQHPLYTNREEFKLLHEKLTNKKFLLRIITANQSQKKIIQAKILKRVAFKNDSLTKLQHYIFEAVQTYCSMQFKIYLLFGLDPPSTLREEILSQGTSRSYFTQDQLIAGFQNLINGLLWVRFFKERHGNINTHHIYSSNNKMVLADPLICPEGHEHRERYPSPEKLKEMSNKIDEYNYYQSDIYSIAMCMLQAIPTVKMEGIYKRNYTINEKNLREELNKCAKYPKLKTLLESLLIDPYNLENRKRYLQIFTNKCNYLFNQTQSSSSSVNSQKTVKIHSLGKSRNIDQRPKQANTLQQNKRNKFNHFNQIANIDSQINAMDKPQIQTKILLDNEERQHINHFTYNKLDNRYPNNPTFSKQLTTNQSRTSDFSKKVVFNYNNSQPQQIHLGSFNQLKTVSSVNFLPTMPTSNFQVPHHMYTFNTSPYNPIQRPKVQSNTRVQSNANNHVFSRSSSDYSVKSQLVVYQPSKSSFNVAQLISPRQQYTKQSNPLNSFSQFQKKYNQNSYTFSMPLQFQNMVENRYKFDQDYNNMNMLNQINRFGQKATSFGVLQNQKGPNIPQESYVMSNIIQQTALKQYNTNNDHQPSDQSNIKSQKFKQPQSELQSLPLKLSILVKNNIPEAANQQNDRWQENNDHQQTDSMPRLKTPQRTYVFPTIANNRTIPEQSPQQEQSFDDAQRNKKGQYKIQEYQTGGRYEGFFANDMRNGYGTFYYKDGGYYQGEWKNNLMNGHGKLFYDYDRPAYDGQWYNDQFHGKGKVYNDSWVDVEEDLDYSNFQNNDFWVEYHGELAHDVKEGYGKWKFSNGQYYEGQFKNDLPDGKGVFYSNQKTIHGFWSKGKLLMEI